MNYWITLTATAFILSFLSSWIIIYLLGKRLLDVPSDRSSHTHPTPRGGGIAIAMTIFVMGLVLYFREEHSLFIIVLPMLMAILGVLDDFISLKIKPRLLVQFILAVVGTYFCIKQANLSLPVAALSGGILVVALMWLTNLYNFMDGINGIATVQAISICVAMGIILHLSNTDPAIVTILIVMAFACAGFLYWNFPVAKIFMGDTGSLFLGFSFGLIALKTSIDSSEIAVAWLIIMAVFIVDASYTLGARLFTGQKFYLPHRSHSYQKLAITFRSHTKTTLLMLIVNIAWLFPIALLCTLHYLNPMIALTIAYGPLIFIAIKLKAGTQD